MDEGTSRYVTLYIHSIDPSCLCTCVFNLLLIRCNPIVLTERRQECDDFICCVVLGRNRHRRVVMRLSPVDLTLF